MVIDVQYKESSTSNIQSIQVPMSMLAFIKHAGTAGIKGAWVSKKILKCFGIYFHFFEYLSNRDFQNNKFSLPSSLYYDPTEKGQFSNIAGKAIADFLAKVLLDCFLSVNYEAAMLSHYPLPNFKEKRPDLYAFSNQYSYAIEAKGYSASSISNNEMLKHKEQSETGGIPVNKTIASVTYNMYEDIKCNFYDPEINEEPFSKELLSNLSKNYYTNILDQITLPLEEYDKTIIQKHSFYKIPLNLINQFNNESSNRILSFEEFTNLKNNKYFILIPLNIKELATIGITENYIPFPNSIDNFLFNQKKKISKGEASTQKYFAVRNQKLYIDRDYIGLLAE